MIHLFVWKGNPNAGASLPGSEFFGKIMNNRQRARVSRDVLPLTAAIQQAGERKNELATDPSRASQPEIGPLQFPPDRPMLHPARQQAVLQMQRTVGNSAVNRMLTSRQPGAAPRAGIQRFSEAGHKMIGDKAYGDSDLLTLGPGLEVTFGDAVAMGDYFGSFKQMKTLAEKPGKGPGTQGEVRYVLWVQIRDQPVKAKMDDWYDKYAVHVRDQASRALDSTNISHFPNPKGGDPALDPLQKNQRKQGDMPFGALASYRTEHEMAMQLAYMHGQKQEPMPDAVAEDAYACHFLTDSFSASHVRTPRASIKEHWDKLVPDFHMKLIRYLADRIDAAHGTADHWLAPIFKGAYVKTIAMNKLKDALGTGDSYSFGNLVSLIIHDAEGASGVEATIEGKPITLVGDSGLVSSKKDKITGQYSYSINSGNAQNTFDAAVVAVKASVEDLYTAYNAGWHSEKMDEAFKKSKGPDLLYTAERLLPKPVDDANLPADKKSLPWKFNSANDFLSDPRVKKGLEEWGKIKANSFRSRLDAMHLSKQDTNALAHALLDPLASGKADEIRKVILAIIAHS